MGNCRQLQCNALKERRKSRRRKNNGNNEKNNAKNNADWNGYPAEVVTAGTKGADYRRRGVIDIARISPNGFVLQFGANSGLHGFAMRKEQGVGGTSFRAS
jgi:hypothetical protein